MAGCILWTKELRSDKTELMLAEVQGKAGCPFLKRSSSRNKDCDEDMKVHSKSSLKSAKAIVMYAENPIYGKFGEKNL